jgi:hypothetical protein
MENKVGKFSGRGNPKPHLLLFVTLEEKMFL